MDRESDTDQLSRILILWLDLREPRLKLSE